MTEKEQKQAAKQFRKQELEREGKLEIKILEREKYIPFTNAEKFFFKGKDFRHIINLLKSKRL